jgi:hypothetical protein
MNPLAKRVQRLQRQFAPAPDYRQNPVSGFASLLPPWITL